MVKVSTGLRVNAEAWKRLRIVSIEQRISASNLVDAMIDRFLSGNQAEITDLARQKQSELARTAKNGWKHVPSRRRLE